MTNEELEELLNKDIPKDLDVVSDSKFMLNKCKMRNMKNKKIISKLSIALTCMIIVLASTFGIVSSFQKDNTKTINSLEKEIDVNSNYNMKKIEINLEKPKEDETLNSLEVSYAISKGEIVAGINYDLSKHPKYYDWKEVFIEEWNSGKYQQEHQLDPDRQPNDFEHCLINELNTKYYELIENLFPNQRKHYISNRSGTIQIIYTDNRYFNTLEEANDNMEDYVKQFCNMEDYSNLLSLSNEEYITNISIFTLWPSIFFDE